METGYIRDIVDSRDWVAETIFGAPAEPLPSRVTLEAICGPAWNQGQTYECVAYSAAGLKRFHEYKQSGQLLDFDKHALYAACKAQDGQPAANGTFIRIAMKIIAESGMESDAGTFKIGGYARLTTIDGIRRALYDGGPVLLGVWIQQEHVANLAPPYIFPMPTSPTGGHCMLVVGYDDDLKCFRVRNSWGAFWGECGHCWIPYDYVTNDPMFDAWTAVDI